MAERGFNPNLIETPRMFEDLHLSLIMGAGGNLEAIRSLVQGGRVSESDIVRLSEEIDGKIKDGSYFDDLTGEQMEAVQALQDYLSEVKIHEEVGVDSETEKFGSDTLGKVLDLEPVQGETPGLWIDGDDLVEEDPTLFGSGALGRAIDQDADPGTEIIGRPASTLDDDNIKSEADGDSDLGFKDAA